MAKADTKKATAPSTELVKPEPAAVGAYLYGDEHAGAGFEGQDRDDISLPWLVQLQGISQQVAKNEPEGSRPGMLMNNVTGDLYDGKTGVLFVPCFTKHQYVQWIPRDDGGGFVAAYDTDNAAMRAALEKHRKARLKGGVPWEKTADGKPTEIVDTHYVFGVLCDDEEIPMGPIIISFASTKVKPYKTWNSSRAMFTLPDGKGGKKPPPLYSHLTRIRSVEKPGPKNGSYFTFQLDPARGDVASSLLDPTSEAFLAGFECYKTVRDGNVSIKHEGQNAAGGNDEDATVGPDGKSLF